VLSEGRSSSSSFDKERAIAMLKERGVSSDEIASLTTKKATFPVSEKPLRTKGKKK